MTSDLPLKVRHSLNELTGMSSHLFTEIWKMPLLIRFEQVTLVLQVVRESQIYSQDSRTLKSLIHFYARHRVLRCNLVSTSKFLCNARNGCKSRSGLLTFACAFILTFACAFIFCTIDFLIRTMSSLGVFSYC